MSQQISPHDETVCTDKGIKSGAPAVERMSSESPFRAVDNALELDELLATLKPKFLKIELPKFSWDVAKFCLFWEHFESTVDCNPSLSTIDIFNYLKALLENSAACLVQGLSVTEANYPAAIDILKE